MLRLQPTVAIVALFTVLGIGYAAGSPAPANRIVDVAIGAIRVRTETRPVAEAAPRGETRPLAERLLAQEPALSPPARFDGRCLPADRIRGARIVALGAYEGAQDLALSFEGEDDAVSMVRVHGAAKGDQVVVVLSAYDPVVWDFARFPRARLRAVLVYGHHDQAVAHLPDAVPVRFTAGKSAGACGQPAHAYKPGKDLDRLNAQVGYALGREIDAFYGGYDPAALHVDGGGIAPAPFRLPDLGAIQGSASLSVDAVRPGEQGLRQLVESGSLRPANAQDVRAWLQAAARHGGGSDNLDVHQTYVVLKSVTLPRGMHGAHSRAFIIPPGTPHPVDHGSHNAFYFVADGSCRGSIC
jgi:hypothetical protein